MVLLLPRRSMARWIFLPFLLVLATWLPAGSAAAEDAPPAQPSEEVLINSGLFQLSKKIDLTQDQREAVRPILKDYWESMQRLPDQWRRTWHKRAQYHRILRRLDEQRAVRIENVLTKEQVAKYRALREQRGDWMMAPLTTDPKENRSARSSGQK